MAGWIYSLSILLIFQSIEEEVHTPSLVGLMAEINDPTSVYHNPGALGFLKVDKGFHFNLATDIRINIVEHQQLRRDRIYLSFLQVEGRNRAILSIYAFGFYFAVTSLQEARVPIIAKRFGNFAAGIEVRDNSLNMGTLLAVSDKFRVAFSSYINYAPKLLYALGGFTYQPSDWYYLGVNIFPHSRKFKIVNAFLDQPLGLDNINSGLEIDTSKGNLEWKVFVRGVFSFNNFYFAFGWNSGVSYSPEVIDALSSSYGLNIVCSLHGGF